MEKFEKERREEMRICKKISREEWRLFLRDSMVSLKESKRRFKKLNYANKKLDKFKIRLNADLKLIENKLKLLGRQVSILNKKKKFLLSEIEILNKHEKANKMQIGFERKLCERLNK